MWNLSPSEQDVVFPFITGLIDTQEVLREVAQFAADDFDVRARFLSASQATAQKRGWALEVKLNAGGNSKEELEKTVD